MENCVEKKYQSDSLNELFAALAKAQSEMEHASKGADNPYFKSKFADLPSVINASRPALAKHGLSVNHFTDVNESGHIILICQLNHSSGQWMRGTYPINPVKNDPQGIGSAITYAKRYTYSAITGVAAIGEDDDGNAAAGNDKINRATGEIKPSRITPNDGALENLSPEDRNKAQIIASNIRGFFAEGRESEAYDEFYAPEIGNELKLGIWEILKTHSKIRSALKKMREEQQEAA